MSVVYRARDSLHGRDVALKLLSLADDEPHVRLYLQQEFHAMARLRHPRLVQVFDYGVLDTGASYFTMELLGGVDLSALRNTPLQSVFQILLAIVDALGFMHVRGYAHRDVKPSNVRILPSLPNEPLEAKLMDCGLTERFERVGSAVAGTFAYLAPEAWLGSPPSAKGDLYALGVLAYEITAGGLPFDTSTGVRLLKTKTERPPDLRDVRPDVPAEFARLVRDLLMPEPASRPASAMEVASRLAELADIDFQPDPTVYLHTPALVGRNRELTELRGDINRAFAGTPIPTVVVGPAGTGKTRLLDEILLEMGLRGAVVARATGRGFSGGPYEVLRELLAPLTHLPGADAVLGRMGARRTLLPTSNYSSAERVESTLDPLSAQQSLHQSFAAFLDGISKHQRVILAIDDIHLADAASVDALAGLNSAGTYGNIAVVAANRTGEPVSQSLAHWLASARLLEIDRMTQAQITELIVAALGPAAPSPTLIDDLERATAGNVYFVIEILRSLTTQGLIERKRTRIVLPDSLQAVELPLDLSQAIERRLASLSPPALALAQIVAVVGRATSLQLSRALMNMSDAEFFDALDELRRGELIQLENRNLNIYHPRLREVLYQGLGLVERRNLHQRVADQILTHSMLGDRDPAAELGHHYAEAGDATKALQYLVRAGDARYQGFAYFDAREAYQRAFELIHSAPVAQRRELEGKLNDRLGRICFYHDHRNGPQYLERAGRYHLRHGLLWMIAPLSRLLGAALAVAIALTATAVFNAMRLRRSPLRLAVGQLLDAFAATTYLANCYTYSGRPQLALKAAERLLPYVYSRQRLPYVGYLMARVYALFQMNRFDESAKACEDTLAIVRHDHRTPVSEHDRIHATGGALITRLWIDLIRGHCNSSPWWQPLEQYVQDHSTALLESWMMEARVYAAYRQGDLAETEAAWKRFREKAAQAEVMFVQLKTKAWVGMAYLDVGRNSDAQDMADEVISSASTPENPFILALGLHLRGMALHGWEQLDDAELCFSQAAQLTHRSDVACWELFHAIKLSWALLLFDRGQHQKAKDLAQRVVQQNSRLKLSHDLHSCRALRILGRVALVQGAVDDAVQHLKQALALAAAMNDSLERARSCHFLAQALMAHGDATIAAQYKLECEQLLLSLGNRYQLTRLGYMSQDSTEHSPALSALTHAINFGTDSDLKSTLRNETPLHVRGSCPEESVPSVALDRSEAELCGHTLVATGPEKPPSGALE